ncbi:MAG: hypothetical protein ACI8XC_003631, partial [Gammaproteobacteria bacterium]
SFYLFLKLVVRSLLMVWAHPSFESVSEVA